jgi:hypothetical protein
MGDLGVVWPVVPVLVVLVGAAVVMATLHRRLRTRRMEELDRRRLSRRLVAEDLAALPPGRARDEAARLAQAVSSDDDLAVVTAALAQGAVPCAFDPRHGAAETDATWSPSPGVAWSLPSCRADADRIAGGAAPEVRSILVGHRWVPWFAAGPALDGYVSGYFGRRVEACRGEAAAHAALLSAGATDREVDRARDPGVWGLGEAPVGIHHRLGTAHVKGRGRGPA